MLGVRGARAEIGRSNIFRASPSGILSYLHSSVLNPYSVRYNCAAFGGFPVPTPHEMIKLSGSFTARAKLLRRLGNAKQADLYELASRVAMERARRLAGETRRPSVSVSELSVAKLATES